MEAKLYLMPFDFGALMQRNRELPSCNLGTSIAQNIFLIISSKHNEHRFDEQFGCGIWDKDFETITDATAWQEEINSSIRQSLNKYEQRLEDIHVDTLITEQPYRHPVTRVQSIKKKVIVNVRGTMKATGEPFAYSPQLFLSPISID